MAKDRFSAAGSASTPSEPVGERDQPAVTPVALDVTAAGPISNPPLLPSLIGMVIGDRYQVQAQIGQGGMGAVYVARHKTLGSRFAVKVLLYPQDAYDGQRFLREARLASKVNHPNTVYIADFGVLPDGRSYLVMEFLRGRTLAAVGKEGPMAPRRACAIAAQIAHGLYAVHKKGVIHRDLFPLSRSTAKDFQKLEFSSETWGKRH